MDIRELLDDHLPACVDRQLAFSDLIGGASYSVDLQNGSVAFVGGRELHVGLIGSAAAGPGTWLWAWANPTSYPAQRTVYRCRILGAPGAVRRVPEHATCGARTDIDFIRELPLAVALMEELLTRVPAG